MNKFNFKRHVFCLGKTKGFTLPEVFLGLMIFSMIILILYSSLWSGVNINNRAEKSDRIYREINIGLYAMGQELAQATTYDFTSSYPQLPSFFGAPDGVSFLLPTDEGLSLVSYYLVSEEETVVHKIIMGDKYKKNVAVIEKNEQRVSKSALVRAEFPFVSLVQDTEDKEPSSEIMCLGIEKDSLKFSYAYAQYSEDEIVLTWKNEWTKSYIPAGVKFEFNFINPREGGSVISVERNIYIPTGYWGQEKS